MSRWMQARSTLDRVVAAAALMVVWPFIAVLGLAVRLSDRGPAFVGVPRMGRGGQVFTMWKLRSMRADNADGRANGVSLTSIDDNRITPIGTRLRAYYLDELPQLWNVVRGEMGLLGARPEAPEFVDLTDPRWKAVLQAPPGIAGPTQLMVNEWERHLISACGQGSVYVDQVVPIKLAIDGWYLRSASPRLDALVAITLVRRFMPGTGSHTLKKLINNQVPEAAVIRIEEISPPDHADGNDRGDGKGDDHGTTSNGDSPRNDRRRGNRATTRGVNGANGVNGSEASSNGVNGNGANGNSANGDGGRAVPQQRPGRLLASRPGLAPPDTSANPSAALTAARPAEPFGDTPSCV